MVTQAEKAAAEAVVSEQRLAVTPVNPKTGQARETNFDKSAPNPNKRHSIAEDPDGRKNRALAAKMKKS